LGLVAFGCALGSKLFRRTAKRESWLAAATCLSTSVFCAVGMSSTESAIANGDTRTIRLYHAHTGESIEATYRVNGHYDAAVLEKLNWFLRDWRRNETTKMDPRLFDAVWEAYRGAGATEPVTVVCGYRSPETNAMLRARSRSVAEHSQHILGRAMDTTMPGMSMERVREVAMRLQMGGVGYYASANFVHIDVGGVRSWPRMSYDQLVRLFPDGKTVHIASNGQALARYEEARAELQARGSIDVPPSSQAGDFLAWLFSGGHSADEREEAPAGQIQAIRVASHARANDAAMPADDADRTARSGEKTDKTVVGTVVAARGTRHVGDADADADLVPLPPSRPVALASLVDVPIPPLHRERVAAATTSQADSPALPNDTAAAPAKKDAIGNLITATNAVSPTNLPSLITRGTNDPSAAPTAVLAYTGAAQIEGLRSAARNKKAGLPVHFASLTQTPPPLIPARLDHSNFLMLTGSAETAWMPSQTVLGPTVAGLRQVARNQLQLQAGALSNVATAAMPSQFSIAASDLPTDRFVNSPGTAYAAVVNAEHVHVVVGALALKNGE
jgi:uncharacterized protein YcbK (DUF882 family)